MKTERMPWTCRWSEFRPVEPAPLWLNEWLAQWACLSERRREMVSALDRCMGCARWEPRGDWTARSGRDVVSEPPDPQL